MDTKTYKVIVIGSGPAGLTAGLYAARAGLNPLILAGFKYGGQLMDTTVIENFPGFPEGIKGPELMDNMIKQAGRFGAEIKYEDVKSVDLKSSPKKLITANGEYLADVVIVATGSKPRRLGVPGEDALYGRGVSTCATCDGALFRGQEVAIVGGGDTAMEEALFLTQHASKVHLLHRRDQFRASKIMSERVMQNPKIEIHWFTEIDEVVAAGDKFDHLKIRQNQTNEKSDLKVAALFLAIGHLPVTEYLGEQLELNEEKYIMSADGVHTSIPGVFVAGDVQDYVYRQAITAAGMGCRAALEAQKFIQER